MKLLPEMWVGRSSALIKKHQDRGWRDIRIGVPDEASSPNRLIAHATAPDGARKHYSINEDESGFSDLDRFLSSN